MDLSNEVIKDFSSFRGRVNELRGKVLRDGEVYTDKSLIDSYFFGAYDRLVSSVPNRSVVEYGGGVPILSLFYLQRKQLSKLIVVDNDSCVLRQLDSVARGLKVKVDVRNEDVNTASLPDADMGVSFNALYGFSPTPEQMNCPPVLSRKVVSEANHKAFGVFRHLSIDCAPWAEFNSVVDEMRSVYNIVDKFPDVEEENVKRGLVYGFRSSAGFAKLLGEQGSLVSLYFVLGLDRKP